ncbi:MAG: winged helix-turn-helix domain-containing protein, partial [Oscillospiraceae bacterium]|nr:winged helix-turn-helix domain-containing protein [Oscillospiraceae bacterium]
MIWVIISALRKKLLEIGAPLSIKTIRGAGYTLE